jgi:hypothetical protein
VVKLTTIGGSTAVVLLDNGFDFTGSDIETIEMMLECAAGQVAEDALATWFRARQTPLGQPPHPG